MLRPVLPHLTRNAMVTFCLLVFASCAYAGTYTIKSGDNPASIAKKAGISVNELMKANPGLDPRKLRVGQELTIPGDKGQEEPKKASSKKTESPSPSSEKQSASSSSGSYTVKAGDTPGGIANSNGVTTKELMQANPGLDPSKLKVGQKLVIPGKGETAAPGKAKESTKASEEEAAAKKKIMEKAEKIAAEQAGKPQKATSAATYKVQKGDSMGKIASKFKISLNDLRKANGNLDPRKLRVGQTLKIPGQDDQPEEEAAPAKAPAEEAAPAQAEEAPAKTEEAAKAPGEAPQTTKDQTQGKGPMDADAYFERGNELGKQNKFQQAIESFDKAIKINSERADYYASRGHAFYYMKLYSRAIEDYTKAIERNAKFALAYSMRGLSRTRNNQFQQAVSDYDKAIELSPKEADYYKGRGWTYFHLKQFEPMCADYKKACDLGDCEFLEVAKKSNLCTDGQ